ncbi:hypothetical protein KOW79_002004 [Hemibagrus wyckioides]|uniref:Uncharacterized protein n=1 Tax=Hemibagrus wyckioides TaxID=337641 RepID=A0A9D3P662_9TELE|nr:hypothetical protein KOW79_002004 [Hemibagrus wyckioides]
MKKEVEEDVVEELKENVVRNHHPVHHSQPDTGVEMTRFRFSANESAPTLLSPLRSPPPPPTNGEDQEERGAAGRSRRTAEPRQVEGRTAEAGESCARLRAQLTARKTGARDTMGGRNRYRRPSTTNASSVSLEGIL